MEVTTVSYDPASVHDLPLSSGTTIRHGLMGVTRKSVVLEIVSPFGDTLAASLTPVDAVHLAMTLLINVEAARVGTPGRQQP